jgi:hypothetical protein
MFKKLLIFNKLPDLKGVMLIFSIRKFVPLSVMLLREVFQRRIRGAVSFAARASFYRFILSTSIRMFAISLSRICV